MSSHPVFYDGLNMMLPVVPQCHWWLLPGMHHWLLQTQECLAELTFSLWVQIPVRRSCFWASCGLQSWQPGVIQKQAPEAPIKVLQHDRNGLGSGKWIWKWEWTGWAWKGAGQLPQNKWIGPLHLEIRLEQETITPEKSIFPSHNNKMFNYQTVVQTAYWCSVNKGDTECLADTLSSS